jgi:CHAT domain-containing protein
MADDLSLVRSRMGAEGRAALDEYADARRQLADIVLGPAGDGYAARLAAAKTSVERAEAKVAAQGQAPPSRVPVTVEDVARAVPEGAALVELYVYKPFQADPALPKWGAPRYAALVVGRGAPLYGADLGDAASIDDLAARFRVALADPHRADVTDAARALYDRVMQPLAAHLPPSGRILVSPDGALDLVPFAALVDERGRYLVDRYSFVELTTGRDLLRLSARRAPRGAPVIIADPAFGPRRASGASGGAGLGINLAAAFFPPLPGTAAEGAAIAHLLPGAKLLSEENATKDSVRALHGPRVLHIATHGFFLDGPERGSSGADRGFVLDTGGARATEKVDDPLLHSGIALAGANSGAVGSGLVTALEAASLDLDGTQLVVLSACETGVGEAKRADGVYGLRRAMVLAGVEAQVTSLWKVDDEATRDLMISFYSALSTGRGRDEALREAQLATRAGVGRAHPYYWASFVPLGDYRTLDGRSDAVRRPEELLKAPPGACGCRVAGEEGTSGGLALGASLVLSLALTVRRRGRRRG